MGVVGRKSGVGGVRGEVREGAGDGQKGEVSDAVPLGGASQSRADGCMKGA